MENFNTGTYDMYKDISARTNGEIYIGVIGAVRTGKSSFFKRIMTCQCSAEITGSDYNSSISVIKS